MTRGVSTVQVYCDFSQCMYNDDGCCDREKIFLDANGVCCACVYVRDEEDGDNYDQP